MKLSTINDILHRIKNNRKILTFSNVIIVHLLVVKILPTNLTFFTLLHIF